MRRGAAEEAQSMVIIAQKEELYSFLISGPVQERQPLKKERGKLKGLEN